MYGTRRAESLRPFSGPSTSRRTALSSVEARLRGARLAPRSAVGQHRHGVAASRFISSRFITLRHRFAGWTMPVTSLTGFAFVHRSIPWQMLPQESFPPGAGGTGRRFSEIVECRYVRSAGPWHE